MTEHNRRHTDEQPGGSTPSQYGIPEGATDLQDLIEHRQMNFALGNIFKACYRRGTCPHSDDLRDMRKVLWFAQREIDRLEAEARDRAAANVQWEPKVEPLDLTMAGPELYNPRLFEDEIAMNVQEAVKQTLDIYKNEDEYQSIENAMDYLLQVMKVNDSERIAKAVYEAKHPKTEISDPYMSGYRAGWNDALKALGTAAAGACATALVDAANSIAWKTNSWRATDG